MDKPSPSVSEVCSLHRKKGNPVANLTIYKTGSMQPIAQSIQGESITLNIPRLKRSDNGTYQCVAENKIGNRSVMITLIIIGKLCLDNIMYALPFLMENKQPIITNYNPSNMSRV